MSDASEPKEPTPAAPPPASPAERAWGPRQGRPAPGKKPAGGRVVAFWSVLAAVVALVALIAALAMWPFLFSRPRFLPLVVDAYPTTLPPLEWARQDVGALMKRSWLIAVSARNSQQKDLLMGELNQLSAPNHIRNDDTVVIFLAGFIVFDREEVPYLLPADGNPDAPEATCVPLKVVLDKVRACPARKKLLLLDVMRPLLMPERGLLRSYVTEKVWKLLDASKSKDLAILTACSKGQVSHAAAELGHSVFGHFVQRGLGGDADRNRNGWVTVHELVDFVSEGVDRWVWDHLGERQTPVLLGGGDATPLTVESAAVTPPPGLPADYPAELTEGWRLHDDWWQRGVSARARRPFLELGRILTRSDRRWRSGMPVDDQLGSQIAGLTRQYAGVAPPRPGPPSSLAEVPTRPAVDEDTLKTLRKVIAQRDRVLPGKATEEALKPIQAAVDKIGEGMKDRPQPLAALVVECAATTPFGPDSAWLLAGLLQQAKGTEDLEEVRFLMRLARRGQDRPADWSAETARLAVEACREAARARRGGEEAGRWVGPIREAADDQRARASRLLFEAVGPWDRQPQALLKPLPERYRLLGMERAALDEAVAMRDDALCLLPSYPLAPEVQDDDLKTVRHSIEQARRLRQLLLRPVREESAERTSRLREIEDLTRSLRREMGRLLEPLGDAGAPRDPRFLRLLDGVAAGRRLETQTARVLLSTPWPTTDQRLGLWDALREGVGRPRLAGGAPSRWDEGAVKAGERHLRQRDLRLATGSVLSLLAASVADQSEVEKELARLERNPANSSAWRGLSAALKKAWAKEAGR